MRAPPARLALLTSLTWLALGLAACVAPPSGPGRFDLQGHRGARGLLPENTAPSFLHALDLGATTVELDVVVTGDGRVIVSHEPWFAAAFSSLPDGTPVTRENEREHALYRMTYAQASAYDVGRRGHPDFPRQRAVPATKPLLAEVFATCDAHARARGLAAPRYNVEIKSREAWDGVLTPPVDEFAALVAGRVVAAGVAERTTIQSFDERALVELHAGGYPGPLALLVGTDDDAGLDANLAPLGFTPATYSPHHSLVDAALVAACQRRGMAIVPWTVNDPARFAELLALGVDGIITDYPDLAPPPRAR